MKTNPNTYINTFNQISYDNKSKTKISALDLCIHYLLNLSISTTNASKSLLSVLQFNTNIQQQLNNEIMQLPLLPVPDPSKPNNNNAVLATQSANQQITAQRQQIQENLSLLQQQAQIEQTNLNTNISESMSLIQTSNGILRIVISLTFKANLRLPPDN